MINLALFTTSRAEYGLISSLIDEIDNDALIEYSLFVGGGHFGCFVPYPEGVRPDHARFVNHHMDCYHCFWNCPKRASKFEVFPCVEAVTIDQVWDEARQLLLSEGS